MERVNYLLRGVVNKVFERAVADVPLVQSGRYPGWEDVVKFARDDGRGEMGEIVKYARRKLGMKEYPPTSGNPLVISLKSVFRCIKNRKG